ELFQKTEIITKVHAIHENGRMLVLDYKGVILPMLIPSTWHSAASGLDRGDLIRVRYTIKDKPEWPVHLRLSADESALVVLEHMSDLHHQIVDYEGVLVMFPASPQVKFNVFALQKDLGDGQVRDFTL